MNIEPDNEWLRDDLAKRCEVGMRMGRWAIFARFAFPIAMVIWVLALPIRLLILGLGTGAVVMTKGRSNYGWMGLVFALIVIGRISLSVVLGR
jgi:hypothetical protein